MIAPQGSPPARLSALETSFLLGEEVIPGYLGHVASAFVLDGPAPGLAALAQHVESRIAGVPRLRRRVVAVPGGVARPVWVQEGDLDVRDHVRAATLAAPGGDAELRASLGELLARPIDREHPLWELWVVDGLGDGRWALLSKVHHAIADGAELVAILRALLDPEFGGGGGDGDGPAPAPTRAGAAALVADALRDGARAARTGARRAGRALRDPGGALTRSRDAARGIAEMSAASKRPVLASPLTGQSGGGRALAWLALERDAMKRAAADREATVNDVYLAIVTGGLRRWLLRHGVATGEAPLMAMVPVAVRDRRGDDTTELGMLNVALPVDEPDGGRRLQATAATMAAAKDSSQGAAIAAVLGMQNLLPVALLRAAGPQLWTARGLNVTITSLPGTMGSLAVGGRRATAAWQIGFLTPGLTLTFASMSYLGGFTISLIADPDAIGDLDALARDCADEAAELGLDASTSIAEASLA
ncbi:MAG TPA: wax ester/triacylglycerol synthase family O-acyltransferase [Solirubrobacteraceae bacterium]|nr:wax ester/triacylglycerol synthase family O-acyltransferase [Solirubrobacteraceae bacterium]